MAGFNIRSKPGNSTGGKSGGSRGQAMVESVLALFFVLTAFFFAWDAILSLESRIFADYSAARAARARTVGLNRFMCLKTARAATIPVAGESLLPDVSRQDAFNRVGAYLATYDIPESRGVVDMELWHGMQIETSVSGAETTARVEIPLRETPSIVDVFSSSPRTVSAEAAIESHFPLYMSEGGL